MRILIAEDEPVTRRMLEAVLHKWSYDVVSAEDGVEAMKVLESDDPPPVAILDIMMPGMSGLEVCRRVRQTATPTPPFILLLSARSEKESIVEGIEAGANDYLIKPFHRDELRVRIRVGSEMAELQKNLAERVSELEDALAQINQLQGILPICSYCKNIRDDSNYWQQVENYITEHSDLRFSHSICPNCYEQNVVPQLENLKPQTDENN